MQQTLPEYPHPPPSSSSALLNTDEKTLTTMALQILAITLRPSLSHQRNLSFDSSSSPSEAAGNGSASGGSGGGSIAHMRMALTITHLALVVLGTVNLLVVFVILLRPYMRSITNVYMLSLCLADFIYVGNLTLVAASQLNDRSWPFSSFLCTMYHGTETTGKYASVMFVVLLAADRYCAMCRSSWCTTYRNYKTATIVSLSAWLIAIVCASPLFWFSDVMLVSIKKQSVEHVTRLCIAKWPSSDAAHWYIIFSSILVFVLPLVIIVFCYYNIINRLREALRSCKRMKRNANSRAPYHRVTRLVLWVVVFHVICWTPFWLFNLFSSIFRLRISTQFDRVVINIIHLFPYVNCALNPLLYAVNAENFRHAFHSLFCRQKQHELFEDSRLMLPGFSTMRSAASIKASGFDGTALANTRFSKQRTSTYPRVSSGVSNRTASSERLTGAAATTATFEHQQHEKHHQAANGTLLVHSNSFSLSKSNGHADPAAAAAARGQQQSKRCINLAFSTATDGLGGRKHLLLESKESSTCGETTPILGADDARQKSPESIEGGRSRRTRPCSLQNSPTNTRVVCFWDGEHGREQRPVQHQLAFSGVGNGAGPMLLSAFEEKWYGGAECPQANCPPSLATDGGQSVSGSEHDVII